MNPPATSHRAAVSGSALQKIGRAGGTRPTIQRYEETNIDLQAEKLDTGLRSVTKLRGTEGCNHAKTATGRSRGEAIDLHIGARLRELRMAAGLSQQVLADLINATYQQVRDYEAGASRVTAARLYSIVQALKVDFDAFFEGLSIPWRPAPAPEQRLLLDLAQNFWAIRDAKHREAICLLTRLLAGCASPAGQLDEAPDEAHPNRAA